MFDSTLRKNGQRACISAAARARSALRARQPRLDRRAEAVPARQHQPALAPAEHPGNRAQVLDPGRCRARGRPAADVEAGDLRDRRRRAEIVDECRASRRRVRGRPHAHAPTAHPCAVVDTPAPVPEPLAARSRSPRASPRRSVSRLRRPSSGSEYLLAMISPCSVMRRPPVTLPAGCARIASKLGPPPRPTVPPRP